MSLTVANAQDEQQNEETVTVEIIQQEEQNNLFDSRVSIYFHPLSATFILVGILAKAPPPYFYATVEVPINLSTSLIIRPSYWDGINIIKEIPILSTPYLGKRLGSDIGIRYYSSKGSYRKVQIGLFYYKERRNYGSGMFGSIKGHDAVYGWFDVMGYIGNKEVWGSNNRMFYDIGLGYANIGGRSYLSYDINFGVGFPLGKKKK